MICDANLQSPIDIDIDTSILVNIQSLDRFAIAKTNHTVKSLSLSNR